MNKLCALRTDGQITQLMYANKIIETDDAERDYETLKCYHDIMSGKHKDEFTYMPTHQATRIQQWCRQVEYAFNLIKGELI